MNKTEHLNLNLLEGHDALDPAALNQNAQAIDAAVAAKAESAVVTDLEEFVMDQMGTMTAELDALTAGIGTSHHNCRVAYGSYVGQGGAGQTPNHLEFDFCPLFVTIVTIDATSGGLPALYLRPQIRAKSLNNSNPLTAAWGDNWLELSSGGDDYQLTRTGMTYYYLALGYDPEPEE